MLPGTSNEGFRPARPSTVVSGLMKSSRSKMVTPLLSLTGTTERSNHPLSRARAALCCEVTAYSSTSCLDHPASVAMVSAPIPWGTNPVFTANSGSPAIAPPLEPMGTRDIDSTPPATTKSSHPEAIFCAAMLTASKPEAQKRSSCTPGTDSSHSAFCTTILATSDPCSPTGETQPITTSST